MAPYRLPRVFPQIIRLVTSAMDIVFIFVSYKYLKIYFLKNIDTQACLQVILSLTDLADFKSISKTRKCIVFHGFTLMFAVKYKLF